MKFLVHVLVLGFLIFNLPGKVSVPAFMNLSLLGSWLVDYFKNIEWMNHNKPLNKINQTEEVPLTFVSGHLVTTLHLTHDRGTATLIIIIRKEMINLSVVCHTNRLV